MKQKERLLRLRPFNMANFSSGAGALIGLGTFLSWFFILPATLLVWAGFALPIKAEGGRLNYPVLIKRLNLILLPICVVAFFLFFFTVATPTISEVDGSLLLALWVSSFLTSGVYLVSRASAAMLHKSGVEKFTKGRWFLCLLLTSVLLMIIGALGTILFFFLGQVLF